MYLAIALLCGVFMVYGNEDGTTHQVAHVWHQFVTSVHDWETLIQSCNPRMTDYGLFYELPNFLGRQNEGLAIIDMRNILFAAPHCYPKNAITIYIVLQGTALVVVGDIDYRVSCGNVVIIPPLTGHYTIPDKNFVIAVITTPPYLPECYIPLPDLQGSVNNKITVQSYELGVESYIAKTPAIVSDAVKMWIDAVLRLIRPEACIIEIGSAFGRDAAYIEQQGFKVERTDATQGFVDFLQQHGHDAHCFNILTDEFAALYDVIFANAVFLHFSLHEFTRVLHKTRQ